ncbi:MAG: hypothetical protein DCC48_13405 [Acidobacteria bacterium]|nr:MAG: hypothetical protein DCC48_13405 [Acidobacteriota bacterium]
MTPRPGTTDDTSSDGTTDDTSSDGTTDDTSSDGTTDDTSSEDAVGPTLLVAETTVSGEEEGELPETDGTIISTDHEFEVDVEAGDTYTFTNEGPDELHHVQLFDFADLDPAVVEENLPEFLAAAEEGTPPPDAFDGIDLQSAFIGGSGVFSPGLSGTFSVPLESGNTYAAVCFVSDRAGGPPHAIGHDMFEVFQVS